MCCCCAIPLIKIRYTNHHRAASMTRDNLSLVLHGVKDMRLEQQPIPQLLENDVLIRVRTVGICGSDIHWYRTMKLADSKKFELTEPTVLGHEASGTIEAMGRSVTEFVIGDRVAFEPGLAPCRMCRACKSGRYNLCKREGFGVAHCLARYTTNPSDFCFKLPDHVSFEEGAMLEPLAVAVHACNRGGVTAGHKVVVAGAGPVGLMCMMVAKAYGAVKVCVTDHFKRFFIDIEISRLEVAKKLGADCVVQVTREATPTELAEKIANCPCFDRTKADVTFECSGVESSIEFGILVTRPGGVMVQVGMGKENVTIPLMKALTREVDLRGVFRYTGKCYQTALDLVAAGKINLKPLATHRFPLEDGAKAFETAAGGGTMKVLIDC